MRANQAASAAGNAARANPARRFPAYRVRRVVAREREHRAAARGAPGRRVVDKVAVDRPAYRA